jgi:hypothetical protein
MPPSPQTNALLVFSCWVAFFHPSISRAEDFVAVSSTVSNGYVRTERPDGTFAPETYTFKEGGFLSNRMADDTIDKMTFAKVARDIAGPLAGRNYIPSVDPKAARLLIVVYWGTSRAQGEFSPHTTISQNMEQDQLGMMSPSYTGPYDPFKDTWQALQARGQDFADKMINEEDAIQLGYNSANDPELKEYRYFVVLLAYDLQAFLRDRKQKLLWQTRFSMNEHRNRFDVQLKAMAIEASAYFGRDSLGLKHGPLPEGHVEIGELKSMDTVPNPGISAALAPDGVHVAYLTKRENGLVLAIADIDRQESNSAGTVPSYNGQPVQLTWLDAGRIVVRLPSSDLLVFDDRGKRVDLDPRSVDRSLESFSQAAAGDEAATQVQALADGKLPGRKVVILGSDEAGHRFLLVASDRAGTERYFVYDRPNDLLYEVGRPVLGQ